jgi:oligosaccharide 4-alpha-D-glucosyltransferase
MLFENYAKEFPNTRLFHLNRSGFSGSQRYCIFPWTGDVSRNWSGLRSQLPNILGMSMSGIPYIHSDAGGFAMGEGDAELYLRWLQFSLFTPIFRPHGTALFEVDPNAFSYPSEPALADVSVLDQVKYIVDQRYRLLPYNYTLAYRQAVYGEPLIKPLYYQYPNDTIAIKMGDEFLWGDAFLIAPVVEKGQQTKNVYLPAGNWYDYFANTFYKGSQTIRYNTSNYQYPVFVKAGSFVPEYPLKTKNVIEQKTGNLNVLYIKSEKESIYQLYLDDGISKNAINSKKFELIDFSTKGLSNSGITFSVHSNGGVYEGKLIKTRITITVPAMTIFPKQILINNHPISILDATEIRGVSMGDQAIWNLGKQQKLIIPFDFTGKPIQLQINW